MIEYYLDQRVSEPENTVLDLFLLFWLYTEDFR